MLHQNLDFLRQLKENNNREWFEKHRDIYEESQQELISFAGEMLTHIQAFDPAIGPAKAKDCIFRIYRDVRFSKDKRPYKTARGVVIKPGGRKSSYGAYYIHIEPGASFAGGGLYRPPKAILDAVRRKIYFEYDSFFSIIDEPAFRKTFGEVSSNEQLKRMPKGYDEGHPAENYLRFKSYITGRPLTDKEMLQQDVDTEIAADLQLMQPLLHFFNEAIEEAGEI